MPTLKALRPSIADMEMPDALKLITDIRASRRKVRIEKAAALAEKKAERKTKAKSGTISKAIDELDISTLDKEQAQVLINFLQGIIEDDETTS